jgi:hypothetical protein
MKASSIIQTVTTLAISACLMASTAFAAVAITDAGSSPVITDSSIDAILGFAFTVGSSDLSILSLGLWDDASDGFIDAHNVSLLDGSGLLSSRGQELILDIIL